MLAKSTGGGRVSGREASGKMSSRTTSSRSRRAGPGRTQKRAKDRCSEYSYARTSRQAAWLPLSPRLLLVHRPVDTVTTAAPCACLPPKRSSVSPGRMQPLQPTRRRRRWGLLALCVFVATILQFPRSHDLAEALDVPNGPQLAVVMPFTAGDVPKIGANLLAWEDFPPCPVSFLPRSRPSFYFYANKKLPDSVRDEIEGFVRALPARSRRCFRGEASGISSPAGFR